MNLLFSVNLNLLTLHGGANSLFPFGRLSIFGPVKNLRCLHLWVRGWFFGRSRNCGAVGAFVYRLLQCSIFLPARCWFSRHKSGGWAYYCSPCVTWMLLLSVYMTTHFFSYVKEACRFIHCFTVWFHKNIGVCEFPLHKQTVNVRVYWLTKFRALISTYRR